MNRVSIKGVLIGGIVDVVTSLVFGIPFAVYAMSKLDLAHIPTDRVESAIMEAMRANVPLYVGQSIMGLGCSVAAGYIAAWLAKHDEMLNGALSSFLCVALGLYGVAFGKDFHPLLLQVVMFVSSPAFGLLGGYLRLVTKRSRLGLA